MFQKIYPNLNQKLKRLKILAAPGMKLRAATAALYIIFDNGLLTAFIVEKILCYFKYILFKAHSTTDEKVCS